MTRLSNTPAAEVRLNVISCTDDDDDGMFDVHIRIKGKPPVEGAVLRGETYDFHVLVNRTETPVVSVAPGDEENEFILEFNSDNIEADNDFKVWATWNLPFPQYGEIDDFKCPHAPDPGDS